MEKVLQQILGELKELRLGQEAQGQELKELRAGQEAQGQELKELRAGQEAQGQELKELRAGQEAQGQELKAQGAKIDKLSSDLRKLSAHVEGEMTEKIDALYDYRAVVDDSFKHLNKRLDKQDDRLDVHWQEIMILRAKRRTTP